MKQHDIEPDNFEKLKTPYGQDEEALWHRIAAQTIEKKEAKIISLQWFRYAAAALVLIFAGAFIFAFSYTNSIKTMAGSHEKVLLPDKSVVTINAESSISYKPLWWYISRDVNFYGEAFFEVKKGSAFTVNSEKGSAEVLGTSFNVYSRPDAYRVYCKTGKVQVSIKETGTAYIITPGKMAFIDKTDDSGIKNLDHDIVSTWRDHTFSFNSENIAKVIEVLNRQYAIKIDLKVGSPDTYQYSGYFKKNKSPEKTINILCKTFNLNYKKINDIHYVITDKD